jgi:hypothetical protein
LATAAVRLFAMRYAHAARRRPPARAWLVATLPVLVLVLVLTVAAAQAHGGVVASVRGANAEVAWWPW